MHTYSIKSIATGFSIIILMLLSLGGIAIHQVKAVSQNVDRIYKHPFAVTNAAKNIGYHLVYMQLRMKDLVIDAQSHRELTEIISSIHHSEREAFKEFDVIFERFSGDPDLVENAYQDFLNWAPALQGIISLVKQNKIEDAKRGIHEIENQQIKKLGASVQALIDFAHKTAQNFHSATREQERKADLLLISLVLTAALLSVGIATVITRRLIDANKERLQRNHLVDQHIMIAILDKKGQVVEISNALCRFLGCLKEDVLGKESGFFDNSDEAEFTRNAIWNTIQTGKEWNGEIKRFGENDDIYWGHSSILPNYNSMFELTGFTNIITDATSKKLSVTDNLTKLYNRRRYEEVLPRELRTAKRNAQSATLAIIDIDHFKSYNDTYGHPQGDQALVQVAECLSNSLKRPNDYLFRIGGEEFAVIVSGLNQDHSKALLDRLRNAVLDLGLAHEGSPTHQFVSISIGACVVRPDNTLDDTQLYDIADKALYMAKSRRNCVVVSNDEGC